MTQKTSKKFTFAAIGFCVAIFIVIAWYANTQPLGNDQQSNLSFVTTGRVTTVVETTTNNENLPDWQILEVEVLQGELQGVVVEVQHHMPNPAYPEFQVGDRVALVIGENVVHITSPDRSPLMLGFIGFFLIFLSIVGGKKGMLSTIGLIFSILCIVFILVPLILQGFPVVPVTLFVSFLIVVVSLVSLSGLNAKSITAILGCVIGSAFAALFAFIAGELAFVNGYHLPYINHLLHFGEATSLHGVFVSGIIISSVGAIMDISMTIASTMEELKRTNPKITQKNLFSSGLNVGRDAMGTMSNTLILAFVGSGLSLTLLVIAMGANLTEFLNDNIIATEIIQGIAGSIGIILTVPITTLIGSKLISK